ncbi:hypothetical protein PInf_018547 [Phytophthora infestans]|nr:hypothetical protein PInf_018547 [Phytophthora infestans]
MGGPGGIPEDETAQVSMPSLYARSVRARQSDGVVGVLGVDVYGRDMSSSMSTIVFDGVQTYVETRDGASTASVTKLVVSALASIGSDVSAAATTEAMKAALETVEEAEVNAVEVDCQVKNSLKYKY